MKTPPRACKTTNVPVDVSSTTSNSKGVFLCTAEVIVGSLFNLFVAIVLCDFVVCVALSARRTPYPKQTRFCFTQEELNEEYGLSLEGKLYQQLGAGDVTDDDWLSVFYKKREKGSKIFLHMVRPELHEECRLLYYKVYQALPANNEITHKFATLFAYENCKVAKKNPRTRKVAWAVFGEQVLEHCKKLPGGIDKKIKNWVETNKGVAAPIQPPCVALKHGSEYATLGSKGKHNVTKHGLELVCSPALIQMQIAQVEEMVTAIKAKLENVKSALDAMRVKLQESHQSMWRTEGISSATTLLQGQLEELQKKRVSMMGVVDADAQEFVAIDAQISVLSQSLTVLGVDMNTSANIKEEVDRLKVCNVSL